MGNSVWLIAIVVLLVVECLTAGLTTIWFAAGALCAFLIALLGGGLVLQIAVFLVVSIALLVLMRPLTKKLIASKSIRTNTDSVLGRIAVVTGDIDDLQACGEITLDGMPWSARSASGNARIPAGTEVRILEVRGVKCIVEPKMKEVE